MFGTSRSLSRSGYGLLALVISVVLSAAIEVSPAAAAAGQAAPGSIVYDKNGEIYLTTPTGSTHVQVTSDGNKPTTDSTGDTGYLVPSESNDGVIVAVRNQEFDKGQPSEYTQGYLWVMDRSGNVIRKFKPAQFDYIPGGSCAAPVQELPLGIVNAVISPDGKYIAYTAQTYVQDPACETFQGYSSWIVHVDGTGAQEISDTSGNNASLEIGQWTADSTKLLVDRADFGSIEDFYVPATGSTAHDWTAPGSGDFIDEAYGQPDVRNGIMATEGYSEFTSSNAVRLWTTTDFTHDPSPKCDYSSDVSTSISEVMSRPSLAPDGSVLAYEDSSGTGPTKTGQGIYLVPTSTINNNCATNATLFIQGGADPFWTPAGIYGPPQVNFTAKPQAVTASPNAHIAFTASDSDPNQQIVGYTCSLDGAAASTCDSPLDLSGLADGTHTFAVTADDGVQTGTATIQWRVDTTQPTATLTAPAAPVTAAGSVRVAWSGHDTGSGVASYQLRYQSAAYSGGFGGWQSPDAWQQLSASSVVASGLTAGDDYCWSVRAVDNAGNAGAWSAARCTAIPLDDRGLAAPSGWSRKTGPAYYDHTVTSTKHKGATLKLKRVWADRLGLIATTCRSCGKVAVYVGHSRLGTINLRSASTHNQAVKLLPKATLRHGTVKLKVLSSHKKVAVDGLAVSRT